MLNIRPSYSFNKAIADHSGCTNRHYQKMQAHGMRRDQHFKQRTGIGANPFHFQLIPSHNHCTRATESDRRN